MKSRCFPLNPQKMVHFLQQHPHPQTRRSMTPWTRRRCTASAASGAASPAGSSTGARRVVRVRNLREMVAASNQPRPVGLTNIFFFFFALPTVCCCFWEELSPQRMSSGPFAIPSGAQAGLVFGCFRSESSLVGQHWEPDETLTAALWHLSIQQGFEGEKLAGLRSQECRAQGCANTSAPLAPEFRLCLTHYPGLDPRHTSAPQGVAWRPHFVVLRNKKRHRRWPLQRRKPKRAMWCST